MSHPISDPSRRVAALAEAIRDRPKRAQATYERALADLKTGAFDDALAALDEALTLGFRDTARVYLHRGSARAGKGEWGPAVTDYNRALRLDPQNAQMYRQRADVYAAVGFHELAVADYSKAIRRDRTDARAYLGRGLALRAQGEPARALADYTQAIRLRPEWAKAYALRAELYANMGKVRQAVADYFKVRRLDPTLLPPGLREE